MRLRLIVLFILSLISFILLCLPALLRSSTAVMATHSNNVNQSIQHFSPPLNILPTPDNVFIKPHFLTQTYQGEHFKAHYTLSNEYSPHDLEDSASAVFMVQAMDNAWNFFVNSILFNLA